MNKLCALVVSCGCSAMLASVSFAGGPEEVQAGGTRGFYAAAAQLQQVSAIRPQISGNQSAAPPPVSVEDDDKTFLTTKFAVAVRSQTFFPYSCEKPTLEQRVAHYFGLIDQGSSEKFNILSNDFAPEMKIHKFALVGQDRTDVIILGHTIYETDVKGNVIKGYDNDGKPILFRKGVDKEGLIAQTNLYLIVDGELKQVAIDYYPGRFETDQKKLDEIRARYFAVELPYWKGAYAHFLAKKNAVTSATSLVGATPPLATTK